MLNTFQIKLCASAHFNRSFQHKFLGQKCIQNALFGSLWCPKLFFVSTHLNASVLLECLASQGVVFTGGGGTSVV